jgi:hypothetical protein
MFARGILTIWMRTAHRVPADSNVFFRGLFVALGLFLIFLWLSGDHRENGYRRSAMMNIGIAALGIVFIPMYLYRARASGRKAKAIGLFFLLLIGGCLFAAAGIIVGVLMFGHHEF